MLRNIQSTFFRLFIAVFIALLISACDEAPKAKTAQANKSAEPEKVVIPNEDYNDAAQWSEPRLQFVRDTDELGESVYSSKTDGSDVRIAYSLRSLTGDRDEFSNHTIVRSPNNRYLAASVSRQVVVIDLHNQTHEVVKDGYGVPSFVWSKDSKLISFFASGDLYRYNLQSKELETLPDVILANQMYLLNDQKTFLSAVGRHVSWYDIKTGKEIKKQLDLTPIMSGKGKVKTPSGIKSSNLSPNNAYLFYRTTTGRGVVNVNTGEPIFYYFSNEGPKRGRITTAIFLNDENLIYRDGLKLYTMNIKSQDRRLIPNSYYDGRHMTLINRSQKK